ncbi:MULTISPECIES: DUF4304 domain-containing protein [unclassified Flavobacterium]|jgi:hypothetical protein|uniref:DUF4304 domain-containing protein n=1 Tax=unclassified Flavobacterium TaxID=196869 RepID=UPI0025BC5856|nr:MULTISPECIES: DUF4304 domain-containing protein [unclassified Flavobacterium]
MEKKDLVKLIDEKFSTLGFKRKANNWIFNNAELSKVINLQKSNFGNFFYINYGFIILKLELTTTTHFEKRLGSVNKMEQKRITDLLDLSNDLDDNERLLELNKLLSDQIVSDFQKINTEDDLLRELKKLKSLNAVLLIVKKYFNLTE